MKLVEFNARKHYSEIRSWWGNHAWVPVAEEFLPKNGFVVESGDLMICAGFLYSTDSAFAWLEFVIGNPHISHEERGLGLDLLISGAQAKSKELGFKIVLMSTQSQRLLDRLITNHGFLASDLEMTNLIWRA